MISTILLLARKSFAAEICLLVGGKFGGTAQEINFSCAFAERERDRQRRKWNWKGQNGRERDEKVKELRGQNTIFRTIPYFLFFIF